jgi:N-acetylmuramoyl-L-alanine amidase
MVNQMSTFLITAGHSNTDPGAVANGYTEASIVTEMRNIVAYKLRQLKHTVVTDGNMSDNKTLSAAISLFDNNQKYKIEFHCNASGSSQANGTECIALPEDKSIAQSISKAISSVLKTKLRGDNGWIDQSQSQHARLAYVSNCGIIVELFFLTNTTELELYQSKKWLVAEAIVKVLTA